MLRRGIGPTGSRWLREQDDERKKEAQGGLAVGDHVYSSGFRWFPSPLQRGATIFYWSLRAGADGFGAATETGGLLQALTGRDGRPGQRPGFRDPLTHLAIRVMLAIDEQQAPAMTPRGIVLEQIQQHETEPCPLETTENT